MVLLRCLRLMIQVTWNEERTSVCEYLLPMLAIEDRSVVEELSQLLRLLCGRSSSLVASLVEWVIQTNLGFQTARSVLCQSGQHMVGSAVLHSVLRVISNSVVLVSRLRNPLHV